MDRIEVILAEARRLTPTIRELRLVSADGAALPPYAPGAHVLIEVGGDREAPELREYSLIGGTAAADDPADTYRIAVERKPSGRGGSQFLHDRIEPGARLGLVPAENAFPLNSHPADRLLVAGGIGIAPIFAMARQLARRQIPFRLHYFGQERRLMAYRDEVGRLAGDRATYRSAGDDPAHALDLEPLFAALHYPSEVYVCGPRPLNEAVIACALDHGLSQQQIRRQFFDPAPVPVNRNTPFEVELRRTGITVEVPPDASILETLLTHGYQGKFYCGRGECGFCPLPIIETDGPIEHRDSYLSAEEKASGEQLCICVSRIHGTRLVLDA